MMVADERNPMGSGPTHRCRTCGAQWRLNPADPVTYPPPHPFALPTWTCPTLETMRECCDNAPMGDQIEPLAWDVGVEWEPIEGWCIPLVGGRLAPTAEQRRRLGENCAPTMIDGRIGVVAIRPTEASGCWLVQTIDGAALGVLEQETDVYWDVRFGTAPISWLHHLLTLGEFDGW
jgi:hypothetical protein